MPDTDIKGAIDTAVDTFLHHLTDFAQAVGDQGLRYAEAERTRMQRALREARGHLDQAMSGQVDGADFLAISLARQAIDTGLEGTDDGR